MQEEWLNYLEKYKPELYKSAINSIKHQAEWRDERITQLEGIIRQIHILIRGFN